MIRRSVEYRWRVGVYPHTSLTFGTIIGNYFSDTGERARRRWPCPGGRGPMPDPTVGTWGLERIHFVFNC